MDEFQDEFYNDFHDYQDDNVVPVCEMCGEPLLHDEIELGHESGHYFCDECASSMEDRPND